MPVLSSAQLAAMARTVRTTLLDQTATISRTSVSVPARIMPNGTVNFGGDSRLAPLVRYHLTLPVDTDLRTGDHVSITGKGTFLVLDVQEPMSFDVATTGDALLLYDAATGQVGLTTTTVNVLRAGATVLTGVLVHIEPFDARPFELVRAPGGSEGETPYVHFTFFTLQQPVPDIRLRDRLVDPNQIDPLTGVHPVYFVSNVRRWEGSHAEVDADKVASTPTT